MILIFVENVSTVTQMRVSLNTMLSERQNYEAYRHDNPQHATGFLEVTYRETELPDSLHSQKFPLSCGRIHV